MYYWDDGTIAYFLGYKKMDRPPSCGRLSGLFPVIYHCINKAPYFLCEKIETPKEVYRNQNSVSERRGIQLSKAGDLSVSFPHVTCPSGHWTYRFLACDIQSFCLRWHRNSGQISGSESRSLTSLCQSPLSELFTCRNGLEHVPYSLVCDHRQDCLDFSDEDFCVHPSCSSSLQFECSNKQVRNTPKMVFDTVLCKALNLVATVQMLHFRQMRKLSIGTLLEYDILSLLIWFVSCLCFMCKLSSNLCRHRLTEPQSEWTSVSHFVFSIFIRLYQASETIVTAAMQYLLTLLIATAVVPPPPPLSLSLSL